MTPEFEPFVPLYETLLFAILNPATIAVAFWLGRLADQKAKLLIAAFGGAFAGFVVLYFAALFGIWDAPRLGRAAAGVFVVSLVAGLFYAAIGYFFFRRKTG